MKFIGIEKVHEGKFVSRYDVKYETADGNVKNYEMLSRKKELKTLEDLKDGESEAVILIIHSEDGNSILLNKEFRMAVGESVFNFPAGLIDPGEDYSVAAKRELWEETGLDLISIDQVWPVAYSAVGMTNEKSTVVVGKATGEFKPSTSAEEEIEANWYTKEEMREILKTCTSFAARTQAYCMLWANS